MKYITLLALLLTACAATMTPRTNTREDVVRYVNRAATVVERDGAAACDAFKSDAWMRGDWYIFVLDASGKTVCHPARPEQVGAMAHDLVDANGNRFGDELMTVAKSGGGWVEYAWARPGQTAPSAKRSYVRQVTAPDGQVFVIGSGGYELP